MKYLKENDHIVIYGMFLLFMVALLLIVVPRIHEDSGKTIVVTSDATAAVQYIPIVVTAVPEPDIPGDLWRCLQNPTLAQDAPDIGLDYHNYIVMGLDIQPIGEKGQINTYQVYNRARPDDGIKKVIVQWAVESDGHQTVGSCQVPVEWYPQYLGPTPYILPSEVPRQGEGVGEPES